MSEVYCLQATTRKREVYLTPGVASARVTATERFNEPMQKIVRCKSCLTTSTGYRGEACIKTNPRGNSDRLMAVCSFLSGQSRTSKGKSLCVRLRSEQCDLTRSHYILTTRNPLSNMPLFSCCELSKAIINNSSVLKRERKEAGKEGERVERERGRKGGFFSLQ